MSIMNIRPSQEIVDVNTAEVKIACGDVILRSIGIGSCIVIAAHDGKRKAGAMAHIMLPGKAPADADKKTKYAEDTIEEMLRILAQAGSNPNDIDVCLVGAGNVLQKEDDVVCQANIKSVTAVLEQRNIRVKVSVVGGFKRKGIFLDAGTGVFSYTEGDGNKELLWESGMDRIPAVTAVKIKTGDDK